MIWKFKEATEPELQKNFITDSWDEIYIIPSIASKTLAQQAFKKIPDSFICKELNISLLTLAQLKLGKIVATHGFWKAYWELVK